jgi:hypothetical protein
MSVSTRKNMILDRLHRAFGDELRNSVDSQVLAQGAEMRLQHVICHVCDTAIALAEGRHLRLKDSLLASCHVVVRHVETGAVARIQQRLEVIQFGID